MSAPKNKNLIMTPGQKPQEQELNVLPAQPFIDKIASQEGKLIRMIEFYNAARAEVARATERAMKATHVAARLGALLKSEEKRHEDLRDTIQALHRLTLRRKDRQIALLEQVIASLIDADYKGAPRPNEVATLIPRPFDLALADHRLDVTEYDRQIHVLLTYYKPKEEAHANNTDTTENGND